VRIAEVSGQTPDREQRPPADPRGRRAGAKRSSEPDEADLLTLGDDALEAEPTEPDAPRAEKPTDEPEADADAAVPDAGGIDVLA